MYKLIILISIYLSIKTTLNVENFNFFKDFIVDRIVLNSICYTLCLLGIYKLFMFDKNDLYYYKYINKLGKLYLSMHELYSDKKLIPSFNRKKRYIKKVFYILILIMFIFLNNLVYDKMTEISILCILFLILYETLFSKKERFIKETALKDFYNQYLTIYEKTKKIKKNFGEKHYGERYEDLSVEYLNWLASDNFKPRTRQRKFILIKKFAEYKLSSYDLKEIIENKFYSKEIKENIDKQQINFPFKLYLFFKLNN